MKENYIYNNKVKIILICILILNIILMAYLIYHFKTITTNTQRYDNMPTLSENDLKDIFGFQNGKELISIELKTREISVSELSENIENFATKALPYISKNVLNESAENVKKIYKDNTNFFKDNAGIESEKEFIELCNKLKNVDCNLNELSKASYVDGTAEYSNNILKVNVKLMDKDEKYITVKVTYNKENKIEYKYEIIEE